MKKIEHILSQFSPISLNDMDGVKLMNRTDTKFIFQSTQLPEILSSVGEQYFCLEVEGKRSAVYQTLYYDTGSLGLYLKHHNGELNRYKVRHRTYVDSNLSFLEIKFKNNKGRTIKDRIKEKSTDSFGEKALHFLSKGLPFDPKALVPVVWVNYTRITLVSKNSAERVTIDVDMEFVRENERTGLNNLVIAEVKQDRKKASQFLKLMKSKHIREGSLSKYCSAIAFMYNGVKKNNFKEKLMALKHIVDHDTAANIH